ncbi:MAG: hypothetical protein OEW05_06325 [Candidatus Aminicenantes bacterium]|nr:hypothetical protein [Candidatus Aminicenantes bacterium]
MKKVLCAIVLALAVPAALLAYDNSPSHYQILPEATWAAATGGGTWVTEVQITCHSSPCTVLAYYYYGTSWRSVTLYTTSGWETSIKYGNILATMQALDGSFTYYGTSGCLWLITSPDTGLISAIARIYNGNYGKTFPGLQWTDSNTANVGRNMRIMNVLFSSNYRTFAGFHNAISGGYSMTCTFGLIATSWNWVGSSWNETFVPWEFKSFNIFTKAGITSGTYMSNWFYIYPQSSGSSGTGTKGLIGFGSIANNTTNDTYAIIPVQWQ